MIKLRIKTKLALGLGFFFIMIVMIGGGGLYTINRLAGEAKNILKANYESIEYAENMEQALDLYDISKQNAINLFEKNLKAQENNITEVGEQEATNKVRQLFEQLKTTVQPSQTQLKELRTCIYVINDLNTAALLRKNNETQQTAEKMRIYLAILVTISLLISFTFLVNFPGYIANPVRKLTEGIKQIADKNYTQRIYIEKGDEFGELAEAFNTMAQELNDYNNSNLAKIIFEKKRIDTIINNMKDPIIGFDEKMSVLFVNASAIKILGVTENDLLGKYAPDIALRNDLLRTLISTDGITAPLKIYADNKESYFTKDDIKIMADEQPIGMVIVLRNITQYKELDLAKTNFIATISHELKTPISSIKMSLKLLEDTRVGLVNEEQKKLIGHIKDDTQRLLGITGELLDLAQVETGNIQMQKQLVEPRVMVDYAYNALKVQAEQKKIKIEINCDSALPKVNCDSEKTAWVLVNFLSNAIRYSHEDANILMQVKQQGSSLVFSVQDFGMGIDPKYKDRLFERFYKVPSGEQGKSGTGLGLAISKEFIMAQGGNIWVESEPNKGSKFSFDLTT